MMDKELQEYLTALEIDGRAQNTLDAYGRDLKRLKTFLEEEKLSLEEFDDIEASRFISYLLDLNMSRSTISRHLVSIRNFYKYLWKKNKIKEAPILYFDLPLMKRNLPEFLTKEEVEKLLLAPDISTHKGKRDQAILELMYAAGLKATELTELTLKDVDMSRGNLSVKSLKTQSRLVPIGKFAIEALRDYLNDRDDILIGTSILFPSQRGEKMSRQGLWKILKTYAHVVGEEKNITLNTLRHPYAVHMLEGGADLKAVSNLLGHQDLKATAIYTELIQTKKHKEIYDEAHPRA